VIGDALARADEPRLRAFEYMLDRLGRRPRDVPHRSSSFRYDLMPAHDLGIRDRVRPARRAGAVMTKGRCDRAAAR
jgi:FMN phosphatase YigB (HAD superfamily)